jgi:hypothetical protein
MVYFAQNSNYLIMSRMLHGFSGGGKIIIFHLKIFNSQLLIIDSTTRHLHCRSTFHHRNIRRSVSKKIILLKRFKKIIILQNSRTFGIVYIAIMQRWHLISILARRLGWLFHWFYMSVNDHKFLLCWHRHHTWFANLFAQEKPVQGEKNVSLNEKKKIFLFEK